MVQLSKGEKQKRNECKMMEAFEMKKRGWERTNSTEVETQQEGREDPALLMSSITVLSRSQRPGLKHEVSEWPWTSCQISEWPWTSCWNFLNDNFLIWKWRKCILHMVVIRTTQNTVCESAWKSASYYCHLITNLAWLGKKDKAQWKTKSRLI